MEPAVGTLFCGLFLLLTSGVGASALHQSQTMSPLQSTQYGSDLACPTGWTLYKTSCYRLHDSDKVRYDRVKKLCDKYVKAEIATVDLDDARELAYALNVSGEDSYWLKKQVPTSQFCQALNPPSVSLEVCDSEKGFICQMPPQNMTRQRVCPKNTFGWKDKCYWFSDELRDYNTSQDACERQNGNLATAHDRETLKNIHYELRDNLDWPVWIGLRKSDANVYTWRSGEAVQQLFWKTYHLGIENEQCVGLERINRNRPPYDKFLMFTPTLCSTRHPALCETVQEGQSPAVSQAPPVKLPDCPPGWVTNGQFCYKVFDEELSWSNAQYSCREEYGDLISLHSEQEASFVKDTLLPQRLAHTFWIGMRRSYFTQGEPMQWIDGTAFDYSKLIEDTDCGYYFSMEINPSTMDWACVDATFDSGRRPYICKRRRDFSNDQTTAPPWVTPFQPRRYTTPAWDKQSGKSSQSWTTSRLIQYAATPASATHVSAAPQPDSGIGAREQTLNVQFAKRAADRLDSLPQRLSDGARLAIAAILAVAEQSARD